MNNNSTSAELTKAPNSELEIATGDIIETDDDVDLFGQYNSSPELEKDFDVIDGIMLPHVDIPVLQTPDLQKLEVDAQEGFDSNREYSFKTNSDIDDTNTFTTCSAGDSKSDYGKDEEVAEVSKDLSLNVDIGILSTPQAFKIYRTFRKLPLASKMEEITKRLLWLLIETRGIVTKRNGPNSLKKNTIVLTQLLIWISQSDLGLLTKIPAFGNYRKFLEHFQCFRDLIAESAKSDSFVNGDTLRLTQEKVSNSISRYTRDLETPEPSQRYIISMREVTVVMLSTYNSAMFSLQQILNKEQDSAWYCSPDEVLGMIKSGRASIRQQNSQMAELERENFMELSENEMTKLLNDGSVDSFLGGYGNYLVKLPTAKNYGQNELKLMKLLTLETRLLLSLQVALGCRIEELKHLKLKHIAAENKFILIRIKDQCSMVIKHAAKRCIAAQEKYTTNFSYSLLMACLIFPKLHSRLSEDDLSMLKEVFFFGYHSGTRYDELQNILGGPESMDQTLGSIINTPGQPFFRKVTNAVLLRTFGTKFAGEYMRWMDDMKESSKGEFFSIFNREINLRLYLRCSEELVNGYLPSVFGNFKENHYLALSVPEPILDSIIQRPMVLARKNTCIFKTIRHLVESFVQHMAILPDDEVTVCINHYVPEPLRTQVSNGIGDFKQECQRQHKYQNSKKISRRH